MPLIHVSQAFLDELQTIVAAAQDEPKAAQQEAHAVYGEHRPTRDMTANAIYKMWLAAGRPEATADGLAVDTRGAPLAWSSGGDNGWRKYDEPAQPVAPGEIDIPIENQ